MSKDLYNFKELVFLFPLFLDILNFFCLVQNSQFIYWENGNFKTSVLVLALMSMIFVKLYNFAKSKGYKLYPVNMS